MNVTSPVPPTVIIQTNTQAAKNIKTNTKTAKGKETLPVIEYTAKKFAELFHTENEVKFPANTKIKIVHIDPILGHMVQLAEDGDFKDAKLLELLEDVLLLEAKTVKKITSMSLDRRQFKHSIETGPDPHNFSFTMHANQEFTLVTERGELQTTVHRLFNKMQGDQMFTFTIGPNQRLTFNQVPREIIQAFFTEKKKAPIDSFDYLRASSPPHYTVSMQATHLYSDFYDKCGTQLTLSDKEGMQIFLTKAPD